MHRAVPFIAGLCAALVGAAAAAAPAGGGVPSKPKPKPKPYVAPKLDSEPAPTPTADTRVVEVPAGTDLSILARPNLGAPMIGAAPAGSRIAVRGAHEAPDGRGCGARRWLAVEPAGWVCASWVRRTEKPATTAPVLRVAEGQRLPYAYIMVGIKEGELLPMWASADDLKNGAEPIWQLMKGDTVALGPSPWLKWNGESYYVAVDGRVLPARGTFRMGPGSAWAGLLLGPDTPLPFAWSTPEQGKVYARPDVRAPVVEVLARRTRVPIAEERGAGRSRWVRLAGDGDERWMQAGDLNEVRLTAPPDDPQGTRDERWIDVDVGEQVLVAYEGARPVFATLISSGRAVPTPRGRYPIWAKVSAVTMKSQPYEDKTYYVDRVPWSLFFQAHNAIHGAYWHDRFGVSKSHGCVNVSPLDARWLFEWVPPALPVGWSGTRTPNLFEGVVVQVRSSHRRPELVQERPMGPPDREEERLKREEAEARRMSEAAERAGLAPASGPSAPPTANP